MKTKFFDNNNCAFIRENANRALVDRALVKAFFEALECL